MTEKNYITLCLFFKIKDSEVFGGVGSVGYEETNSEFFAETLDFENLTIQKYIEVEKKLIAKICKVSIGDIEIISRQEYEENTND